MSLVAPPPVNTGAFSASAMQGGRTLVLTLQGNGDMSAAAPLAEFLASNHELAVTRGIREVSVDLRLVEFMNSSCLKGFVRWLSALQDLPVERQYIVRFVPNSTRPWQRASLLALAGFATDLVQIDAAKPPTVRPTP